MSEDNQSDQSYAVGEMFDVTNIAQPVSPDVIPNGFTPDDIQPPVTEPSQEGNNE